MCIWSLYTNTAMFFVNASKVNGLSAFLMLLPSADYPQSEGIK